MKPLKLRTKLTLFYAAVITLLLATTSLLFYKLLAYQLNNELHDDLRNRAAALLGYLHFDGGKARLVYNPSDPEEAFFIDNATRYFQVFNATTGAMMMQSQQLDTIGVDYTPQEVQLLAHGPQFSILDTDQVGLVFCNDLVRTPAGEYYLVQVGSPVTIRNSALKQMLKIIGWLLPSAIVIAVGSGWWMAGRVLRPVESLSAAAQEVSISKLHKRLPLTGTGDELDQLAGTFNEMFARLEKAVGQMREFNAIISHELRTPLTALRGEAEVALARARSIGDYRQILESQLEEFEKLSQMIDHMLILARAEAGQIKLARDVVNLSELARSLVEQMEIVADSNSIALTAELDNEVNVVGDAGWLERVILNLVDNAIKFTRPGGHVEVGVRRHPGEALLQIRDNGIGILPEALPHIFEWFYRGDPSRTKEPDGAGLGLSLVQWIVREHQGRITVESQPGNGSVFCVMFPLAGVQAAGSGPAED